MAVVPSRRYWSSSIAAVTDTVSDYWSRWVVKNLKVCAECFYHTCHTVRNINNKLNLHILLEFSPFSVCSDLFESLRKMDPTSKSWKERSGGNFDLRCTSDKSADTRDSEDTQLCQWVKVVQRIFLKWDVSDEKKFRKAVSTSSTRLESIPWTGIGRTCFWKSHSEMDVSKCVSCFLQI